MLSSTGGAPLRVPVPMRLRRAAPADPVVDATGQGLRADAVVWLPLQNEASTSPLDSALHGHLYRQRADVVAVVICRPTVCTALACSARIQATGIPMFHPDLEQVAGGNLPCVALDPSDSIESLARVTATLADRSACLLADKGLLVIGATPQAALQRAAEIEALAQIYWRVMLLDGVPA